MTHDPHTPDLFAAPGEPAQPPAARIRAMTPSELLDLLWQWSERGWLRALDRALVRFGHQQRPEASPLALLLVALTSHQVGRGHVCLNLDDLLHQPEQVLSLPPDRDPLDTPPELPADLLRGLQRQDLISALQESGLVAEAPGTDTEPLILQAQATDQPALLYLRRYWHYERQIEAALRARLDNPVEVDHGELKTGVEALFGALKDGATADWQRIACALAARQRFAIITGGPGTGKTTTVVRLLALLQSLAGGPADSNRRPLRIALTAPTGKAAARLNESIEAQVDSLDLSRLAGGEALRSHIPKQVTTLHRLLGARPDSRHFRHHAGNPLHLDLIVVDEASMVDVELMARLFDAIRPETRVILLGDKDQLASVEAGAVLGNLCQRAETAHYRPELTAWIRDTTGCQVPDDLIDPAGQPLDQAVSMLRVSHRFGANSGIGLLARAVNQGEPEQALQRLQATTVQSDIQWFERAADTSAVTRWCLDNLRPTLEWLHDHQPEPAAAAAQFDAWATEALQRWSRFQLLCAVRSGPQGVEALNRQLTAALHRAGLVQADHRWYAGRPVMVTRNDYALGLMNGDIGITLNGPALGTAGERHQLRVAFPPSDGSTGIRWVLPSRLQAVDTVYAMTVHKSQGSEFDHTALLLPARQSPVLTRELIYTGITRAKSRFTLLAPDPALFAAGVEAQVRRVSGLVL